MNSSAAGAGTGDEASVAGGDAVGLDERGEGRGEGGGGETVANGQIRQKASVTYRDVSYLGLCHVTSVWACYDITRA